MRLEPWCWVATTAYAAHIAEEFALNWRGWVRSVSRVEISPGFFGTMNALVIVLGAFCASAASRWPAIALAFPALMLVNATFFHVGASIWLRRFSPGTITAILLFYPIAIACYRSASRSGTLTGPVWIESLLLAAVAMAAPMLLLGAGRRFAPRG